MTNRSTGISPGDSSPVEEGNEVRWERVVRKFPVLNFLMRVLAVLVAFNVLIISVELTRELNEAFRVVIAGAATVLAYGAVRLASRFALYKFSQRKGSGVAGKSQSPDDVS